MRWSDGLKARRTRHQAEKCQLHIKLLVRVKREFAFPKARRGSCVPKKHRKGSSVKKGNRKVLCLQVAPSSAVNSTAKGCDRRVSQHRVCQQI
mmetsp:Transcript_5715/g.35601  ORF Transcript_5715/g.35601 Transcript_5715/m.35601 type:complete len:93 (-) Transcript_5715:1260-1538(-)